MWLFSADPPTYQLKFQAAYESVGLGGTLPVPASAKKVPAPSW
jgi:hypothetical protein